MRITPKVIRAQRTMWSGATMVAFGFGVLGLYAIYRGLLSLNGPAPTPKAMVMVTIALIATGLIVSAVGYVMTRDVSETAQPEARSEERRRAAA